MKATYSPYSGTVYAPVDLWEDDDDDYEEEVDIDIPAHYDDYRLVALKALAKKRERDEGPTVQEAISIMRLFSSYHPTTNEIGKMFAAFFPQQHDDWIDTQRGYEPF